MFFPPAHEEAGCGAANLAGWMATLEYGPTRHSLAPANACVSVLFFQMEIE
jgi:hypothetical protein